MKVKPWVWKVLAIIAGLAGAFIAGWLRAIGAKSHVTKVQTKYEDITNKIMAKDALSVQDALKARDQATKEVYSENKQAVIDRFMANFGQPPSDLGTNGKPSAPAT